MNLFDVVFTLIQGLVYLGLAGSAFYIVYRMVGMRRFLFSGYVVCFVFMSASSFVCLFGGHDLSKDLMELGRDSLLPVSAGVVLLLALERFLNHKIRQLKKTITKGKANGSINQCSQ